MIETPKPPDGIPLKAITNALPYPISKKAICLHKYQLELFMQDEHQKCLQADSTSPPCGKFEFDQAHIYQHSQNAVSKKRKATTLFETTHLEKRTCNNGVKCAAPRPPPLPASEIDPTHHYQLSPSCPLEMLSNLRANLTANTSLVR
uniref:Uncharacterized protein n=1 Tax=Tanacetum cinerariifolium TaxID=118510 RepID=A0A6L2NMR3_TANCI|nr:hypothetical protein [Tanacetum cinerariifolium]